jgi:hypothetical protein
MSVKANLLMIIFALGTRELACKVVALPPEAFATVGEVRCCDSTKCQAYTIRSPGWVLKAISIVSNELQVAKKQGSFRGNILDYDVIVYSVETTCSVTLTPALPSNPHNAVERQYTIDNITSQIVGKRIGN